MNLDIASYLNTAISSFKKKQKYKGFNIEQQKQFLEDFKDGIASNQAPIVIVQHLRTFSNGAAKRAAIDIHKTLNSGKPASVAFSGWFDDTIIQAIRAGEKRRALLPALDNAISSLQRRSSVMSKIFAKNTYPLVMMLVGMNVNVVVYFFIFQEAALKTPVARWPMVSQWSYGFSEHMVNFGTVYLALIFVLFKLSSFMLANWTGQFRKKVDNWPIFRHYRMMLSTTFLSSLSMMLNSQIRLVQAIETLSKTSTPYMRDFLNQIAKKASSSGLGQILDVGLLTDSEVSRLKTLTAKNAGQSSVLESSSIRHDKLLDKAISRASIVIMLVGYFGAAMFILLAFGGQYALQMMRAGMTF
ncbi:MAG: type II secretion system F family protein [Shewanella xiamenensis]|uniref:Type II secretion system F family protein n=2 Tax=Shewanella TaxID=22 RepID=A0AAE4Q3G2_9GAMM|nr:MULTISPECIES: type II secretion system F family protein [Shewanella]MCD8549890.1 type II secretion system F family protein [Shewanella xiamenensis]MCD8557463.1 type II secretion system F family protein [Shewanella xiamenensis]MCK7657695.1 type II secretion system F family protein [Shewanella sp. JNE4-2]MDH0451015.1 type II secretion system F family protein [Shewanella sp. GD04112]MDV5393133.1 type II secretion system F family protein [Shewanella xiamenensis]